MERLLVINPGSTSTKIAVFDDEEKILSETIRHEDADLVKFNWVMEQVDYRKTLIASVLLEKQIPLSSLTCIMARGGQVPYVPYGGFRVDEEMVNYLSGVRETAHVSNVGCVIAYGFAQELGIPSYIYAPVNTDELSPVARITGMPDLPKVSRGHALNSHAVAMHCAKNVLHRPFESCNMIVAHLGGGCSVWLFEKGHAVDMYSDDDAGICPERCGRMQALELVQLCYSGKYNYQEMMKKVRGNAGIRALLGTSDMREVEERIENGDAHAALVYEAFLYTTAKSIGDLAVAVRGKVDCIVITGGIAHSKLVCEKMAGYVDWIAPVEFVPGEFEMEALAQGGLRILRGEEAPKTIQYS